MADAPDLPPVLPAVRTFGTPPPRVTPADLVPLFKRPEPAPAATDPGRHVWVLVAIGLAAAVVGSVAVGVAGLVR